MGRLNYDQAPALGVPTATPTDVSNQAASTAFVQNLVPPGVVFPYAGPTPPTGWLLCDGSAVSRTTYARLFAAIGTVYGTGDGSTTFNLPELRGEFLRALDNGRGVDTGRTLGSEQKGAPSTGDFDNNGTYSTVGPVSKSGVIGAASVGLDAAQASDYPNLAYVPTTPATQTPNALTNNIVGATRPRNVAMNFIIKVQ